MPLWMQGDLSMNTKDAIMERSRLRQRPAIVAELQKWWETVGNSLRSGADSGIASVGKEEYIRIDRLMAKAMTADFSDKEAAAAAEEDWIEDSKGEDFLPRQGFMDGIFELACASTVSNLCQPPCPCLLIADATPFGPRLQGCLD